MKCVHSSSRVNNETLISLSTMVARKEPIDPVLVETKSVLSEVVGKVVGNYAKTHAACIATGRKETSSVFCHF